MDKKIIYIAGKISGDDDYKSHFERAVKRIERQGCIALNPAILPADMPYESYFPICFAMIDMADGIYFLSNYKDSPGALREREYAKSKGKLASYEQPGTAPKAAPIPYKEIQELYNSTCGELLPKVTKLSDARKRAIKARYNAGCTTEDFERLFQVAASSPFLTGTNSRGWKANFDWLIRDANMAKVLDGNYNTQEAERIETSYDLDEMDKLALMYTPKIIEEDNHDTTSNR